MLDEILARLNQLPEAEKNQVIADALEATKDMVWVPNPGPQTQAYYSQADELFYGGQAGGGKSDLIVGLSLTTSERSLTLRRFNDDARDLGERMLQIIGNRDNWNGQTMKYRTDDQLLEFGGCQYEEDKQRYKGDPHDLINFDEITDFSKTMYLFIKTWNRDATGRRCRVVCTGNPPTNTEGLWVISYWGAWLDPQNPDYPTADGVLLWYVVDSDGNDVRVEGPGEYEIDDEKLKARSRTFIRSTLNDNPDLASTDYDAVLSALPPELRAAYRDGKFDAGLKDNPWQCIPTDWVRQAQARWKDKPPEGVAMTTIGCDVAQGGDDNNVLAPRYGGWYAPLVVIPGKETPLGTDMAGQILVVRKNKALPVIDCGGGYGGSAYKHMADNDIKAYAYKGSETNSATTNDQLLGFKNVRTQAYWQFREALDPSQNGGSKIALPKDQRILADLTAPTFEEKNKQIVLEEKKKLIKRIGRSTDFGDAVVMAWHKGERSSSNYPGIPLRKPSINTSHKRARQRYQRH